MGKGDHLGEFEQLVLLAILRLEKDAYGMTVRRELEETARRKVTLGSVYGTLDRLEKKGLVRSWHTEPDPVRGRAAGNGSSMCRPGPVRGCRRIERG